MYSLRLGGRSAARANMLNTTLRLRVLRDGAESSRRPYQTSRRHPRTYILALRVPAIFSRLSTAIFNLYSSGGASLPTSPLRQRRIRVPLLPLHTPDIFSGLSITILTFLEAVEPYLQRHPYTNIGFGFPSSPYLFQKFFPSFYHHFNVS